MKVSYIVLAHEPFEQLDSLLSCLLAEGSNIYLHYDLKAASNVERFLDLNHLGLSGTIFLAKRCLVKWGEWSIAQATLNCLQKIDFALDDSDYFMLISGSCFPIKPLSLFREFLQLNPLDYIECVNAEKRRWVAGGIQNDRWERYHFFNYRFQRRRFHVSLYLQRMLGVRRALPFGLTPHIGSQWWCLRRGTIMQIIDFIGSRPEVERFFSTTCIPDESFFQTLVGNLIPKHERSSQHLTDYKFNSWGVPRVYYDDDFCELALSPLYFARKVSPNALELKKRLLKIYATTSECYNEFVAGKLFNSELKDKQRRTRLLYDKAKRSKELGLLSAHSYIGIRSSVVLLAAPCQSVLKSCLEWFDNLELFLVIPDQTSFSKKSLAEAIREAEYFNPGKTLVLSIHGWDRREIKSLSDSFLETDLVILPDDLGSFKMPHEANVERIKFLSNIDKHYAGISDPSIDLYASYLRSHRFNCQSYPSTPLFDRLLCVREINGLARVFSLQR